MALILPWEERREQRRRAVERVVGWALLGLAAWQVWRAVA